MDTKEIRLRCIEAAARQPFPHNDGPAAAVKHAASIWFDWINGDSPVPGVAKPEPVNAPKGKDVLY